MYREFYAACVDDEPIWPVISILQSLRSETYWDVEIWTGRSEEVRKETVQWLRKHVAWYDDKDLRMRPVGDHRHDTVLKAEWYAQLSPADKKRLVATFDDRDRVVQMWRDLGVTCLQVANGKF